MSNTLAEGGPRTIVFPGESTQVLEGVLPQLGRFVVESVVATIDNTGGPDTTPELTVADPTGEVIATKAQTSLIPAGGSGTATWALRLTDDGGGGEGGATGFYSGAPAVPPNLAGPTNAEWFLNSGTQLFSFPVDPTQAVPLKDGLYAFSAQAFDFFDHPGKILSVFLLFFGPTSGGMVSTHPWGPVVGGTPTTWGAVTLVTPLTTAHNVTFGIRHNAVGAVGFETAVEVVRLTP